MKSCDRIMEKFRKKKIMVVGDFILDEYVYGETERISREAPVLILRHNKSIYHAGGGANPVMNLKALGAEPVPVAAAGEEPQSDILVDMLKEKKVDVSHIIRSAGYSMPVKARIMAGSIHTVKQQIVRIDRYNENGLFKNVEQELINSIKVLAESMDTILVSDYGGGLVTDRIIKTINALAEKGKKIIVDSRYALRKFKNIAAATPNETEAGPIAGIEKYTDEDVAAIGKKLMKIMKARGMVITRGSRGMMVFSGNKTDRIEPFGSDEIVDVSGAGDTVSAITALSLACGASLKEAAFLANVGGGIVVMKRGTATLSLKELKKGVRNV
ncbi:MAG: bifunctional heptose 7-phosphate kinase/heptose 1-phosphate adenyltransferase [Candidatus Goldiibacteriota bacterium]